MKNYEDKRFFSFDLNFPAVVVEQKKLWTVDRERSIPKQQAGSNADEISLVSRSQFLPKQKRGERCDHACDIIKCGEGPEYMLYMRRWISKLILA